MEPQTSSSPKAKPGCKEVGQSESLPPDCAEVETTKQLNEAVEKMKSEITSQITREITKIHTMLSHVRADTDKKIDELEKIIEAQHVEEIKSITQIQADIQENKNSFDSSK